MYPVEKAKVKIYMQDVFSWSFPWPKFDDSVT
jgi:hypothetical protein